MSRRKGNRSYKCKIDLEMIERISEKLLDDADRMFIPAGARLCNSSGVWRCKNGTFTFRLAYRDNDNRSIVITIRNVAIQI